MDINPTSTDSSLVMDGDTATLLKTVQRYSNIDILSLKSAVERHLPTNESFAATYNAAIKARMLEERSIGVCLTEIGEEWLISQANELSVEAEASNDSESRQEPYDVAKLNMETRNVSVFQALRKIDQGQINLRPEFQRAFVWDRTRQSRLIESILIRIPLPAFYLDATDQVNWNVVDGLQRLTTLHNYCRKESFALQGLQFLSSELEGKRFSDLPSKYQVLIEDDTQLLFYNLMPGTPIEAKFTIFSRVNTGGMQLTPQEIRHALNQGQVTETLAKIAEHPIFRSVTRGVIEGLRMSDRELILRVLAFIHLGHDQYRKFNELDAFLVFAMAKLNKIPDSELVRLSGEFLNSLQKVDSIFGKYAFRKFYQIGGRRSPFNKALFEVWTSLVTPYPQHALEINRTKIMEKFVDLVNNSDSFSRSISSSTGSYNAVSTRFSFIEKLLEEATND